MNMISTLHSMIALCCAVRGDPTEPLRRDRGVDLSGSNGDMENARGNEDDDEVLLATLRKEAEREKQLAAGHHKVEGKR